MLVNVRNLPVLNLRLRAVNFRCPARSYNFDKPRSRMPSKHDVASTNTLSHEMKNTRPEFSLSFPATVPRLPPHTTAAPERALECLCGSHYSM